MLKRIIPALLALVAIVMTTANLSTAAAKQPTTISASTPFPNIKNQWIEGDQSILHWINGSYTTCSWKICGHTLSANSADGNGRVWYQGNSHTSVILSRSWKVYSCHHGNSYYTETWHYGGLHIPEQITWGAAHDPCRIYELLTVAHWTR